MARIGRKDNKWEVALRKVLHRRGYRYRLQAADLPGRPDFVFVAQQVAVFVDGDFWHGRVLREQGKEAYLAKMKTKRKEFWLDKMERNIARDDRDTKRLEDADWTVFRVWESELRSNLEAVADEIEDLLMNPK